MSIKVKLDDQALLASVASKTAAVHNLLRQIAGDFSPAVFANSLGAEDMVLTDLIVGEKLDIEIFSLDTGRLPLETYDLIGEVKKHYGLALKLYYPRHDLVEPWTRDNGINAFYESVELRKGCCYVRRCALSTKATGWRNSTPCPTGAKRKSGPISSSTRCRTTPCTTSSTRASAAPPARAPSRRERMSAPGAGGGRIPNRRNADCM